MSKKSKGKRSKKYTGSQAKTRPDLVRVHKVQAVVRNDFSQWIHDHQKLIKRVGIGALIVIVVIFSLVALF